MVVADLNAGQDTVGDREAASARPRSIGKSPNQTQSPWTAGNSEHREDSGVRRNTLASRTCPETLRAEAVLLDCKGSRSGPPGETEQEQEQPSRKTGSTGINTKEPKQAPTLDQQTHSLHEQTPRH
ncbi:hypothetical protein D4764_20G0008330 [Takifugu flavidus]|uniref:Uncharacterized protein n=1 Tax=Takifugu flavidus TaxID=433684 RepID=A0A5C6NJK4_9TELE|nr:hypothetical protein D4764_20G0008330 [Takifugu flavidus]